jgi:D-lactate dehydrogenase (cytochrome)
VVEVPDVEQPATKATLGYPLQRDMDLIDLFIGSEGTLGMVLEIELRLALRPQAVIGVLVVADEEKKALELVQKARSSKGITFDAIEFFDHATLQLLLQKKNSEGAGSHIPDLPSWDGCGVYFEFSGSEDETEDGCVVLEEILAEVGLSLDDTWAAMEPKELAAQRLFRHAVPEAVNSIIGRRKALYPGLHKVGTDMAVPDEMLDELFEVYRSGLKESGIDAVIFGHIGDNHVHVNMLPENMEQLNRAKLIYQQWAHRVVAMGGAVAAEHGIGRMKKDMLAIQYDAGTLDIMQAVKNVLDPRGILSPGVLLND